MSWVHEASNVLATAAGSSYMSSPPREVVVTVRHMYLALSVSLILWCNLLAQGRVEPPGFCHRKMDVADAKAKIHVVRMVDTCHLSCTYGQIHSPMPVRAGAGAGAWTKLWSLCEHLTELRCSVI